MREDQAKGWIYSFVIIILIIFLISAHRDESMIEDKIFNKVNQIRQDLGTHKLTRNDELDSMAINHSVKMQSENTFEHSDHGNIGENIFESPIWYWTSGCGITITNEQVADCMVEGWKKSPGHYENMINTRYSYTGVGVECNIFECKGTQNFK